jgi:hypothetical protein
MGTEMRSRKRQGGAMAAAARAAAGSVQIASTAFPDERRQHGRVDRLVEQIADANGDVGAPWKAEGLLEQLQRRGAIDDRQRQAGEEFQRLFHIAAIHPLKAADMGRVYCGYGGVTVNHGSERAWRKISDALAALGGLNSPAGSCAFNVLGLGMSRSEWAGRMTWRGQNPHTATGMLQAALGVLAQHFGY